MKKIIITVIFLCFFMLIIPLLSIKKDKGNETPKAVKTSVSAKEKETDFSENPRYFRIKTEDGIKEISEEEYIIGVVAAEMPPSYSIEALKAQSVAAYTFALYKRQKNKNEAYDLTDSYKTDQSFLPEDKLKEKWGESYDTKIETIKEAVTATKGEYLSFEGEPALTLYHAVSSGVTNNCSDIFGGDLQYLQSVESECDKLSPDYKSVFSFSETELKAKLEQIKRVSATGNLLGDIKRSESGAVKTVKYDGAEISGSKLCSILDLPSPNFTVEYSETAYTFTCLGKGHGVGLSQYGAGQMALTGSDYKQILSHYYPKTVLKKMLDK